MATARDAIAQLFFGGDAEAAGCLFEGGRDRAATHIVGGARNNPALATDWMPHIGTLLDNHDIGPFEFDVIHNGIAVQTRDLLDAKSQPSAEAIERFLRQGATLRVMGVSRFDPKVASQLQLLRRTLKREVFVNLYLTPAQRPGLNLHYDLEDSIVVQVKGEKHWKLYESNGPRYPRVPSSGPPPVRDEPMHVHMRAGDVLYVPSGLAHLVETRESSSQHITFGVHVTRQVEMLAALLDEFASTQEDLRRPLRSEEQATRAQLGEWAQRFERWVNGART